MTTLMLELNLVRVFDVIWYSNMAYMVITLAMFCFGLSGIYSSLRPLSESLDVRTYLARLSMLFAFFSLAILPALNWIPFDFNLLYASWFKGSVLFIIMYLFLIIPFFLAGLIFTTVFSHYSSKIQQFVLLGSHRRSGWLCALDSTAATDWPRWYSFSGLQFWLDRCGVFQQIKNVCRPIPRAGSCCGADSGDQG